MLFASLALSAAVATAPAQIAYSGTAPVRVASCSVTQASPALYNPFGTNGAAQAAETAISFVNQAPGAVSAVTFSVSDGRTTSRIVDKGTFSSGVAINHSFITPEFGDELGGVSCSVESVAFTDGSIWQAQ
ncbi:MAG TPA: hypothetical protein VMV65_07970 [Alphaproteobacteria bacterium]|nr:hypothetical protein [Alphaproteobacteria bacterium]